MSTEPGISKDTVTPETQHATGPAGRLAQFFVGSKLTPLLVIAALALGLLAVSQTPREEEPQIVVPVVDIFIGLPGASPAEVESRVTVPLERRMWEIAGVEYVYSSSMEGMAMVTVRFLVGDDVEQSLVKVWEEMMSGLDEAPPGITMPLVKSRSIDDVPVLALTLWSEGRYDAHDLRRFATELQRDLSRESNVGEIGILGGDRRQVRVLLDAEKLATAGIDPGAVATALQMQNASAPAGAFETANAEVRVETGAFLHAADEVADVVVGIGQTGDPVHLRDVAEILDGPEDPQSYVFYRSGAGSDPAGKAGAAGALQSAVTMTFAKRPGADAHQVVGNLLERVDELRGELLPNDLEVTVTRDYGATADEKAGELLLHLILAILSVSVVIGFFLGWRGALVVFVSVPVSFALTLFVYYVFGYTLNRVTLFALIFVTGIVVDDSIIVVENIERHLAMKSASSKRRSPLAATLAAVSEVGNPTILATLTVIASVLPMAFVRGLMGPYMRPMPVGASLAMAFSLLVALIAAPWLAHRLMKTAKHHDDSEEGEALHRTTTYRVYSRIVQPLLESRAKAWTFLGVITALLVLSMLLVPMQAVSLKMLPFDNKSELQVILDLPEGTTLETTTAAASEIADRLAREPQVTDLQVYAGTAAPINFNGLVRHYDLRQGPTVADLQVNFLHKSERDLQSHDLAKQLRPLVQEIARKYDAAAKVVEVPPGPPVMSTLVAEVYGPTLKERLRVAEEVKQIFADTPGVVDLDWVVEAPQPKLHLDVDSEKAALHGVPAAEIARTVRLALSGEDAGTLHAADEAERVGIQLELPRAKRSSVDELLGLRMKSMSGAMVPISELVTVRQTTAPISLHRKNLKPVIYVTADVAVSADGQGAESPVYAILDMSEKVAALPSPAGGTIVETWTAQPASTNKAGVKWDGEWHITFEVFRDLGAAFGAVLLLIYLLIVGWFGSFRVPLVMMIAIPLSLVGILPGHWLFGAFFTATSMIGFIALAGIMVRNSVLLIDFIDLELAAGKSLKDAVLEAGSVRFRPILLTAGTVVVGAIVILFDPIFQGLAIALMFGALASTALTLVVVPLVYYLTESATSSGTGASEGDDAALSKAVQSATDDDGVDGFSRTRSERESAEPETMESTRDSASDSEPDPGANP